MKEKLRCKNVKFYENISKSGGYTLSSPSPGIFAHASSPSLMSECPFRYAQCYKMVYVCQGRFRLSGELYAVESRGMWSSCNCSLPSEFLFRATEYGKWTCPSSCALNMHLISYRKLSWLSCSPPFPRVDVYTHCYVKNSVL